MKKIDVQEINIETTRMLFSNTHSGAIIIRDLEIYSPEIANYKGLFKIKEHQEINNGQSSVSNPKGLDFYINRCRLYRKKLGFSEDFVSNFSLTHYPKSEMGAEFHLDFSKNINVIITFFFSAMKFYVADDKNGNGRRIFNVEKNDVLIMRAPRSSLEKALRPIHAIGPVKKESYTLEVRDVGKF